MNLKSLFKNRIKLAGIILIIGLLIKTSMIFFIHPLTFLIDLGLSTLLIVAGIVIYLISFFSSQSSAG